MEDAVNIPFCAPAPSDTVPMLVMVAVFLIGSWLFRRWKKNRSSRVRKPKK